MINLNEFKEEAAKYFHRIMIEVMPQDVVEICDRAIAAESELEAMRAKLGEKEIALEKASELMGSLSNKH